MEGVAAHLDRVGRKGFIGKTILEQRLERVTEAGMWISGKSVFQVEGTASVKFRGRIVPLSSFCWSRVSQEEMVFVETAII